jgi:iron complex transport system substrate-binding protein
MIELAGGEDVLGTAGQKSRVATWDELAAASPDVVVAMPCGLYCDEAAAQARDYAVELDRLGARRVFAVDAASSFSRPGPRLVDGVELLAHLLHPDAAPAPTGIDFERVL